MFVFCCSRTGVWTSFRYHTEKMRDLNGCLLSRKSLSKIQHGVWPCVSEKLRKTHKGNFIKLLFQENVLSFTYILGYNFSLTSTSQFMSANDEFVIDLAQLVLPTFLCETRQSITQSNYLCRQQKPLVSNQKVQKREGCVRKLQIKDAEFHSDNKIET